MRLTLSVWCDEAGLHWKQEEPNTLIVKHRDKPAETWTAGANRPYLADAALAATRLPAGHPEGYFSVLSPIPSSRLRRRCAGRKMSDSPGYATAADGLCLHALRARCAFRSRRKTCGLGRSGRDGRDAMKGPGIFLAQFASDTAPFNSLKSITRWAAGLGYKGVQIPTTDARLFDLEKAAWRVCGLL